MMLGKSLNDVACKHANDIVPTNSQSEPVGTTNKKSKSCDLDFFGGAEA